MKVRKLAGNAEKRLKEISETPRLDAEILLAKALGTDRFGIFTKYNDEAGSDAEELFMSFVARRASFEPVAYITNEKEFFEDTFFVDRRVLIPRPESEFIVEAAVELLKNSTQAEVLDICCGSGCIGLSIKRATGCRLTLSDISEKALEVARINAARLFPASDTVFVQSDLFSKISGKFSIITANPPYLSERDMNDFVVKELRFEPENAFFGGKTGFETTEKILACVPEFLKPNGYFITELGFEGSQFLDKKWSGLELESIIKDYSGTDRTAVFRKV